MADRIKVDDNADADYANDQNEDPCDGEDLKDDGAESGNEQNDNDNDNEYENCKEDAESEANLQNGSDVEQEGTRGRGQRMDLIIKQRVAVMNGVREMTSLDRVNFMLAPLPSGTWLQATIKRVSTGGLTRLSRKFAIYLDDGTYVATCEKRARNRTAHYVVSTDPTRMEREDNPYCVGKIRSNFVGSEFTAYDAVGGNPKNMRNSCSSSSDSPNYALRKELVHISYENGLTHKRPKGGRGRRITVAMPHVKSLGRGKKLEPYVCQTMTPEIDGLKALTEHYSQVSENGWKGAKVVTYINKPAKWCKPKKAWALNFGGRVSKRSVRNFQLVRSDCGDDMIMQFGRDSADTFNLDFCTPMSPFQAFAIAISKMDYKICTQ